MSEVRIQKSEISSLRHSASLRLCGVILLFTLTASAQWIKQTVNTTASFRGLWVVNERVVWASGTDGTVIRTIDDGKSWKVMTVPGAEKLDFRDIEAFDANTAYILSIGNGESSRIYKTVNGGKAWRLQFTNTNDKAFFDALACSDRNWCYAVSDPVKAPVKPKFHMISTSDGGSHWDADYWDGLYAIPDEAAFAASGTCFIVKGERLLLVSGGARASVYQAWLTESSGSFERHDTPFVSGSSGSGIFSIAMFDEKNGVIVGGNYEKPNEATNNLAFTTDGGDTWKLRTGLSGYRSAVTYIDEKTIIAVGTNGTDITRDGGKTWKKIGNENLNSVAARGKRAVWAVGPKGMVVKMK
jgi:photosystem II stability/assembly factor-like uncharacterized protein